MISKQTIIDFFNSKNNEIFGNENDLVLEFAFYLYKIIGNDSHKLKFEARHSIDFVTQDKSEIIRDKECYIDLVLKVDEQNFAFEFKYHTSRFPDSDQYLVKDHVAMDLLRFSFRKDIYRLTEIKHSEQIKKGFAILLTNTRNIYDTKINTNHQDNSYRFRDIIPKEDMGWILSGDKPIPNWLKIRSQNLRLTLRTEHTLEWYDYITSKEKNGTFKYCIVEI